MTSAEWLALAEKARMAKKDGNRKAREIARRNGATIHPRIKAKAAQAQEQENGR